MYSQSLLYASDSSKRPSPRKSNYTNYRCFAKMSVALHQNSASYTHSPFTLGNCGDPSRILHFSSEYHAWREIARSFELRFVVVLCCRSLKLLLSSPSVQSSFLFVMRSLYSSFYHASCRVPRQAGAALTPQSALYGVSL